MPAKPEQKPKAAEELTGYAIARRRDNTFSVVSLRIKGDTVISRSETQPDTLAAALGYLDRAMQKAHVS
ncbi:MAG TPA: hypothetical protein VFP65_26430 [Anaeromyxobacteraceae bacterium]|nr:hypothetical protein [Anaeromyxobacteraceae bacterium]